MSVRLRCISSPIPVASTWEPAPDVSRTPSDGRIFSRAARRYRTNYGNAWVMRGKRAWCANAPRRRLGAGTRIDLDQRSEEENFMHPMLAESVDNGWP